MTSPRPTVSVIVPARDEAATVGAVAGSLRSLLEAGTIDELVVVDDHSSDGTAAEATAAGARVLDASRFRPEVSPAGGKGSAMWKGLAATSGQLVVFCDADLRTPPAPYVEGLLEPLLADPEVALVKGRYRRVLDGRPGAGGRVTALTARPLLAALLPGLATIDQPLGGETAARRSLLESLPFDAGYGVEIGLLVDTYRRLGRSAIAEVDLADRVHRNRPVDDLAPAAAAVVRALLHRCGVPVAGDHPPDMPPLA